MHSKVFKINTIISPEFGNYCLNANITNVKILGTPKNVLKFGNFVFVYFPNYPKSIYGFRNQLDPKILEIVHSVSTQQIWNFLGDPKYVPIDLAMLSKVLEFNRGSPKILEIVRAVPTQQLHKFWESLFPNFNLLFSSAFQIIKDCFPGFW